MSDGKDMESTEEPRRGAGAERTDAERAVSGGAGPEDTGPARDEGRPPLAPFEGSEYFCDARPSPAGPPTSRILRDFYNWAQANSVFILAFGTGCGAIELRPLFTARYDISRYGIFPRPTPRQSGLFIIGGYASVKTMKRIIRSYEQIQNPKFVMGLGSCTVNGGMYWDSYNTINRLDHYIPVDVYVAGCMPRPESLIAGFDRLKELIRAGKAEGANRYAEDFDWYKDNQKKIIRDWNMPEYNW